MTEAVLTSMKQQAEAESILRLLDPRVLMSQLWRHRELIWQFARREVEGRYRGSFLGILWSFVTPLIMLLVYVFVFGLVFRARWNVGGDSLGDFALAIFAGLIAFQVFSETVGRAPGLVVGNPNYVKKVIFPLEILPVATLLSALFHAAISLAILLGGVLVLRVPLTPWALLAPVCLLPLAGIALGLAWFLASLGVYLRDIGHVVGVGIQILMFMSPVFYPADRVPAAFQPWLTLVPTVPAIEAFRRVLLGGGPPSWASLLGWSVVSFVTAVLGYAWFRKTRRGFADVL
jgi:lipopolysaccharide transport system permease protein